VADGLATANNTFSSQSSAGDAQWDVTTIHADGSTTGMTGPVIADDMFRTAMPTLQGKADTTADTPDWAISMAQGYPLSPTKTSAQTAITAKMLAPDVPKSLCKWSLHVGASTDAKSELSVTVPDTAPSQLRALLFDAVDADGAAPQMSEVPIYGGAPHAIHLEQTIGTTGSQATPDVALIRLIFANHPPMPIHLEYVGTLPSPIVAGNVMAGPNSTIPFWVQLTPPSEGDKGAGLVVLVRYEAETSFDVTAQLMTQARTSTPTAILKNTASCHRPLCLMHPHLQHQRQRPNPQARPRNQERRPNHPMQQKTAKPIAIQTTAQMPPNRHQTQARARTGIVTTLAAQTAPAVAKEATDVRSGTKRCGHGK
jgi:hypothetical protein